MLRKLDLSQNKVSIQALLEYFYPKCGKAGDGVTVEEMLRLLMDRVASNGLAVDEAFRHFDTDGTSIMPKSQKM